MIASPYFIIVKNHESQTDERLMVNHITRWRVDSSAGDIYIYMSGHSSTIKTKMSEEKFLEMLSNPSCHVNMAQVDSELAAHHRAVAVVLDERAKPSGVKYRSKPVEAVQWFKHGDHPKVHLTAYDAIPALGKPSQCVPEDHPYGYLDTPRGRECVGKGDWIVSDAKGVWRYTASAFEEMYEVKP